MKKHHTKTGQVIAELAHYLRGRVLDAGGGRRKKYKELVLKHASEYVCADIEEGADVISDLTKLPFDDESFDSAICTQVLEHVTNPVGVMVEINRVLRPGGIAIITAPFLSPIHEDPGDCFRYTPDGLYWLGRNAGFSVVEKGRYGGLPYMLCSMLKFKFFNPYKNPSRIKRGIFRRIDSVLSFFDQYVPIGIYFAGSWVVLKK
ncbi:MAG: class I SAM-dependent methyltransferase [Candidatus Colwellbacteria bacterium]